MKTKSRRPDKSGRSRAAKKSTTKAETAGSKFLAGEILSEELVQLMTEHLKDTLAISFPGLPARCLEVAEDVVRSSSLSQRIQKTREETGLTIKEVAARLKVPQYRLRDAEEASAHSIVPEIFERYIELLGLRDWVDQWVRANPHLARKLGIAGQRRPSAK